MRHPTLRFAAFSQIPETRVPRSPSTAPPPSAGKLDLVEFFLGTDAGRGLVNVSDEVRVSPRLSSRAAEMEAPENERHHDDATLRCPLHSIFKTARVRSPLTAATTVFHS